MKNKLIKKIIVIGIVLVTIFLIVLHIKKMTPEADNITNTIATNEKGTSSVEEEKDKEILNEVDNVIKEGDTQNQNENVVKEETEQTSPIINNLCKAVVDEISNSEILWYRFNYEDIDQSKEWKDGLTKKYLTQDKLNSLIEDIKKAELTLDCAINNVKNINATGKDKKIENGFDGEIVVTYEIKYAVRSYNKSVDFKDYEILNTLINEYKFETKDNKPVYQVKEVIITYDCTIKDTQVYVTRKK